MRAQEVIVSDPERQIIVGTVDAVKAVCMAVRGFISSVQAFDHLLEWPVFGRNSIVVGKSMTWVILNVKSLPSFLRTPLRQEDTHCIRPQ